ncbi:MAG: alkaline phosphatase D family protein [Aeromicrobium sp.]
MAGSISIAAGVGVLGSFALTTEAPAAGTKPFSHGVASGDPLPGAVVLWTRVTPTPFAVAGSGKGEPATVQWEVATDEDFRHIVRSGLLRTDARRDHTIKVDATGLEPATTYFYRFSFGTERSPTGRTRTAPAHDSDPERLRFGVVSCANWQAGYFSSYRHLAERGDLDAVIHLGDYLYEYQPGKYSYGHVNQDIRTHFPPREIVSLRDYRERHAQYKTDPDLRALHEAVPFIVTWDDHEVCDGNWAHGAFEHQPLTEGSFEKRKRAAHQAYDEWMPVRISGTAVSGDGERMYRRLQFGRLADLSMLDLRSYRSKRAEPEEPEIDDPARTIAGTAQLDWLTDNLSTTSAQWKLIGNPVMIAPVLMPPRPAAEEYALSQNVSVTPTKASASNTDEWDGYTADRRRVLEHLVTEEIGNVVFLTGDVHTAWANDVPAGQSGPSVATEFVVNSITSNNTDDFMGTKPRTASLALEALIQAENPHVRFVNLDDHGYSVLNVTPDGVQMDWHAISDRRDPEARSRLLTSWSVASGTSYVAPVHGASPA